MHRGVYKTMNRCRVQPLIVTVITLAILFQTYSACFVRNCPVGGKRSVLSAFRECLRCGEYDSGICLSPSVCCMPHLGCLSDATIEKRCSLENKLPWPCSIQGRYCGQNGGVCVTDGVCCTGDNHSDCYLSDEC